MIPANPRIKELYDVISAATDELKKIRESCSHYKTVEANYAQERPPNIYRTRLCADCFEPIETLGPMS